MLKTNLSVKGSTEIKSPTKSQSISWFNYSFILTYLFLVILPWTPANIPGVVPACLQGTVPNSLNMIILGWTTLKSLIFFVGFFPSVQDFFVCYKCTFKRSLRLFRFKISQFVPFLHFFDRFCGFLIKQGTHCEILNLNNRRLVRL